MAFRKIQDEINPCECAVCKKVRKGFDANYAYWGSDWIPPDAPLSVYRKPTHWLREQFRLGGRDKVIVCGAEAFKPLLEAVAMIHGRESTLVLQGEGIGDWDAVCLERTMFDAIKNHGRGPE